MISEHFIRLVPRQILQIKEKNVFGHCKIHVNVICKTSKDSEPHLVHNDGVGSVGKGLDIVVCGLRAVVGPLK